MKSLISSLLRAFSFLPSALCPAPFALCLLLALCSLPPAFCQIPQGFNYQAIAKDGSGTPIAGQSLPVRISIQSDSLGGTIFWVELHSTVTTNSSGLFTLVVGKGEKQSGTAATFSAIDWSVWPKYIQTEVDYGGWKNLGSSKMWSVPYAMVSTTSDTWTKSGSDIYRPGGSVGIGTSTPIGSLGIATNSGGTYLSLINSSTGGRRYLLGSTGLGNGQGEGKFVIWDWDASANRFTIDPAGNVGIGTTNPTSRFQVDGGNSRFGYNSGNSSLSFTTGFGNSFMFKPLDHALQLQTDHTGDPVIMYLHKAGQVGIGNIDPAYILDVSGRIRLRTGGGSAGLWLNDAANSSIRSFIGMYDDNRVGLYGVGSNWGLVMDLNNGNVGIGTSSPVSRLNVAGDAIVEGRLAGQYFTGFGTVLLVGNDSKLEDVNIGNTMGIYGIQDVNQGHIKLGAAGPVISGYNGNVGIGNTTPASKLSVQVPTDAWADDVPLFEVKNEKGVPVFAVYNYGVRVLVDHNTAAKAPKGGFQVSSYDYTKAGTTTPLMIINPDSIRFNIDNGSTKGAKGGFSVGSFADAKGIDEDFMYITPQLSVNGNYNTFLGYKSGYSNASTGNFNSFIGNQAGYLNYNGISNVFIGYKAGYTNYSGINNVYVGTNAGEKNLGSNNVLIGDDAGKIQTGGNGNVYIGSGAGKVDLNGVRNTYVGAFAGQAETGSDNVIIGYKGGFGSGESNLLVIGNNNNNALISGYFNSQQIFLWGSVGIGMVPTTKLAISGLTGTTSGSYLRIYNDNVYYSSSSRKTKSDIQPFSDDFYKILKTQPVSFTDNSSGERNIGFIAEDFDALGLNELVVYKDGSPISLSYELISLYNLEIIKDQQKELKELRDLSKVQNDKIDRLERMILELERKIASSR